MANFKLLNVVIIYLQNESIEMYQFKLCLKCDKEHDFDVIVWLVVPCRKLRWTCLKHRNNVACHVENV